MPKDSFIPVGYEFIRQKYKLACLPHFRSSFIGERSSLSVSQQDNHEEYVYPAAYHPGSTLAGNLDFALKYEGLNLGLLTRLFAGIDPKEIVSIIIEKPTSQYRRRIWFLYEFLTGHKLPIDDLKMGNYVSLVAEDLYFTKNPHKSPRHRINVNIFGTRDFCPLIRKTEKILKYQNLKLDEIARATIKKYPEALLTRAISYLYTKETKASFQIEREVPEHARAELFISMLRLAQKKPFWNKEALIDLQNKIVDPRFAAKDYRDFQNYVGETHAFGKEHIHYICPKPADVPRLMEGLIETATQCHDQKFNPVLFAAVIAFGFVFIHPFDDGNGRIHRFLIHNILALYEFTPPDIIFPVSAAMVQQLKKYENTLESFSNSLLPLISYALDDHGEMVVHGETFPFYSSIDFTFICERLYEFVENTVIDQIPTELGYLARYDAAKKSVRSIVDMPDRLIDLFIKTCMANEGKLSKSKRKSHFSMLTDDEIGALEQKIAFAIQEIPHPTPFEN